jgi:drug/metabolite transporter (DMT)-like permease
MDKTDSYLLIGIIVFIILFFLWEKKTNQTSFDGTKGFIALIILMGVVGYIYSLFL